MFEHNIAQCDVRVCVHLAEVLALTDDVCNKQRTWCQQYLVIRTSSIQTDTLYTYGLKFYM